MQRIVRAGAPDPQRPLRRRYGGPQPISAPPADQVFDMNQLLSGLPR